MPTYDYECDQCDHAFEVFQSMTDKKLTKCPECGQEALYRLIGSGNGIIFKGTGFYETDYKKKGSTVSSEPGSSGSSKEAKSSSNESKSSTDSTPKTNEA